MSETQDRDGDYADPTDREDFERALTTVIQRARENGVNVEDTWASPVETDPPECYDVSIVPVVVDDEDR
jgi:hypothetical protein